MVVKPRTTCVLKSPFCSHTCTFIQHPCHGPGCHRVEIVFCPSRFLNDDAKRTIQQRWGVGKSKSIKEQLKCPPKKQDTATERQPFFFSPSTRVVVFLRPQGWLGKRPFLIPTLLTRSCERRPTGGGCETGAALPSGFQLEGWQALARAAGRVAAFLQVVLDLQRFVS